MSQGREFRNAGIGHTEFAHLCAGPCTGEKLNFHSHTTSTESESEANRLASILKRGTPDVPLAQVSEFLAGSLCIAREHGACSSKHLLQEVLYA